jgi:hypothetical protein
MARLWLVVTAAAVLGCADKRGLGGRWQGASEPTAASPVTVAFTLRATGDSLRGWGVARTDGRSFPISVHGSASRGAVTLRFAPWRSGVVDIESAQLTGTLGSRGDIDAMVRTDEGLGIEPGTHLTLKRP